MVYMKKMDKVFLFFFLKIFWMGPTMGARDKCVGDHLSWSSLHVSEVREDYAIAHFIEVSNRRNGKNAFTRCSASYLQATLYKSHSCQRECVVILNVLFMPYFLSRKPFSHKKPPHESPLKMQLISRLHLL